MKVYDYFVNRLYNDGLFKDQAEGVMSIVMASESMESMADKWQDDVSGYPTPLLLAIWMNVRLCAVEWIDTNKPFHWARPIFAGGE